MARKYKFYGVLYNATNVYFPVKAELNPYNDDAAYCGGCPQFFGGTDEGGGVEANLAREIAEESLLTYLLNAGANKTIVYDNSYDTRYDTVYCDFYCSSGWNNPAGHAWPVSKDAWLAFPAPFREMCCISTALQSDLRGYSSPKDLATKLQTAAKANAPDWAQAQILDAPSSQFVKSFTMDAFLNFTSNWLAGSLP